MKMKSRLLLDAADALRDRVGVAVLAIVALSVIASSLFLKGEQRLPALASILASGLVGVAALTASRRWTRKTRKAVRRLKNHSSVLRTLIVQHARTHR